MAKHALPVWSSKWVFVLAAIGAAVGLGNVWKFPYIVGKHGGSAFIIVYLVCIFVIGLPLLMAELSIGLLGRGDPVSSVVQITDQQRKSRAWAVIGFLGILSCTLVLSYYAVIAGWTVHYAVLAVSGKFSNTLTANDTHTLFDQLQNNPQTLITWQVLILVITGAIIMRGVQKGLEKAVYVMLPVMVILLLTVLIYGISEGQFKQALIYLFHPNFSALTPKITLVALGHAFFSLSLALGTMVMYGAYLPKGSSVFKASIWICLADTVVALVAGMAIFPIVFANHLSAGSGPGLIFQSLPLAFSHMPFGRIMGSLFFIMLSFAAITSTISLLEPPVVWLKTRFMLSRPVATGIMLFIIWLLGLGSVFSFNHWQDASLWGKHFFGWVDHISANIFLPLNGFLIAIFCGWIVHQYIKQKSEIGINGLAYSLWRFALCWLAPIAIIVIFYQGLFH